jgi:cell division protein FtsI/penicillin-binding protein 2
MHQKKFKRRVYITGLLIFSIACFFIYKLFNLHFTSRILISDQKKAVVKRGYIKDKNGYLLAISIEKNSLFANPEEVVEREGVAKIISPLINESEEFILSRITKKKRFVWLKRKIDDETVEKISRLKISGLHFQKEFKRVYPHGRLASNILGFVGVDNTGLEGIEYKFDKLLSGERDNNFFIRNSEMVQGYSISLTLDRFIQYISERAIEEGVKAASAEQGTVVILEVKTGRILALAKYPNFDPNFYYDYSYAERRNFTVVDSFEPGSTLKIMALAQLLEQRFRGLDKKFFCEGQIEIGDETIKCTKKHGDVSLDEIIKYSCNSGIINAMKPIKRIAFYNLLKRFGFGSKTGVALPGESDGILRSVGEWSGLSKYSISIGQEISVTSLQMVAAFSAIANGGIYQVPAILESVERYNGSLVQDFYPRTRGRVLKAPITKKILRMMNGVVSGGTGKKARLAYYNIAGKTGTSQKSMKRGGYYADKFIASFIGIAPLESPDLCILVVVDEPKGRNSGGDVAAPIFARIARRILPYRGIKISGYHVGEPAQKRTRKKDRGGKVMPDLRGLLLSEALRVLIEMQKEHNIEYTIIGSGKVYAQSPAQNTGVSKNQKIILYLR